MSETASALVWFRDDLRIRDNPALHAAVSQGGRVLAVYVLDELSDGIRPLGGASRRWLHHSLERLSRDLRDLGVSLILRRGAAMDIIPAVTAQSRIQNVYWNRRYGGPEVAVDKAVKAALQNKGHEVESFAASLLHEPWTLKPASGPYFRVYTPFWKAALRDAGPRPPLPAPRQAAGTPVTDDSDRLEDWSLSPTAPDWSGGLAETWTPGENGAANRLTRFLEDCVDAYARQRDRPDIAATSMLSPHLRFGEISPYQVWHAVRSAAPGDGADKFLGELGWREFCWHLLFHNPDLATRNFSKKFDRFPWRDDQTALRAWQTGHTGIPIVDAGMRQLWQTGWMHNRVRMIAASFLAKNLMIDWRQGEAWFWDTLVDADAANNPAGWQWVAGSGADAAPYFRIFNPILQGEKFDPAGDYVRKWVPELADLPAKVIHRPWQVDGCNYASPIVDLAGSRKRALDAFRGLSD